MAMDSMAAHISLTNSRYRSSHLKRKYNISLAVCIDIKGVEKSVPLLD